MEGVGGGGGVGEGRAGFGSCRAGGSHMLDRCVSFRGGKEVHDAFVLDEEAEEFAGEFVDDLDAAPLGGAEVEAGVAEGEVEDVAAGLFEFVVDVVRWDHACSEVGGAV